MYNLCSNTSGEDHAGRTYYPTAPSLRCLRTRGTSLFAGDIDDDTSVVHAPHVFLLYDAVIRLQHTVRPSPCGSRKRSVRSFNMRACRLGRTESPLSQRL